MLVFLMDSISGRVELTKEIKKVSNKKTQENYDGQINLLAEKEKENRKEKVWSVLSEVSVLSGMQS